MPQRIAFSHSGDAAVAFETQDEDDPAISRAFVTVRGGRAAADHARRVPGALGVLDLLYDGATLELLTGSAPAGQACCGSVRVLQLTGRGFASGQTLLRGLEGPSEGQLSALGGRTLLAAIATADGVWAVRSRTSSSFSAARRLSSLAAMPASMASVVLERRRSELAWSGPSDPAAGESPDRILAASGLPGMAPGAARVAYTAAPGHEIDELGLASAGDRATAAWIESWFDPSGVYDSEAVVSDLSPGAQPRTFPVAGGVASGLTLASDEQGDEVVVWKSCDQEASCDVLAAIRRRGNPFGVPVSLGEVDADEDPAAAVSSAGAMLVGWIVGGDVVAAASSSGSASFGAPTTISVTGEASNLIMSFGPSGEALAAWADDANASELDGALYRSR